MLNSEEYKPAELYLYSLNDTRKFSYNNVRSLFLFFENDMACVTVGWFVYVSEKLTVPTFTVKWLCSRLIPNIFPLRQQGSCLPSIFCA
jgi:hypothetical protein